MRDRFLARGNNPRSGAPVTGLPPVRCRRSSLPLKRVLDVLAAGAGLLVLAPAFAVIAVLIKRDSTGPVMFRQTRVGAGGKRFVIYKFRTMVADAEERKSEFAHLNRHYGDDDPRMFKIVADPRVTAIGGFLRRFSLDELPQLINVLRGEMSLVGPRPLIPEEDRFVPSWARERASLRPGITGPWQVLGGSSIPFEEMLELDYAYVTRWSLGTDVKLILLTIPAVVRGLSTYRGPAAVEPASATESARSRAT